MGTHLGGGNILGEGRNRYKVTGKSDEVRMKVIHHRNGLADWDYSELFVVMKVAQLRDGQAIERFRKARQRNIEARQPWPDWLAEPAVSNDTNGSGADRKSRCFEEFPSA